MREEGEGSGGGTEGWRGRAGWIGGRCREEVRRERGGTEGWRGRAVWM